MDKNRIQTIVLLLLYRISLLFLFIQTGCILSCEIKHNYSFIECFYRNNYQIAKNLVSFCATKVKKRLSEVLSAYANTIFIVTL
jgi:hypothetical protein